MFWHGTARALPVRLSSAKEFNTRHSERYHTPRGRTDSAITVEEGRRTYLQRVKQSCDEFGHHLRGHTTLDLRNIKLSLTQPTSILLSHLFLLLFDARHFDGYSYNVQNSLIYAETLFDFLR